MNVSPEIVIAVIGALATAVGAMVRMVYKDMRKDIDDLKVIALRSTNVTERSVDVSKQATSRDA